MESSEMLADHLNRVLRRAQYQETVDQGRVHTHPGTIDPRFMVNTFCVCEHFEDDIKSPSKCRFC